MDLVFLFFYKVFSFFYNFFIADMDFDSIRNLIINERKLELSSENHQVVIPLENEQTDVIGTARCIFSGPVYFNIIKSEDVLGVYCLKEIQLKQFVFKIVENNMIKKRLKRKNLIEHFSDYTIINNPPDIKKDGIYDKKINRKEKIDLLFNDNKLVGYEFTLYSYGHVAIDIQSKSRNGKVRYICSKERHLICSKSKRPMDLLESISTTYVVEDYKLRYCLKTILGSQEGWIKHSKYIYPNDTSTHMSKYGHHPISGRGYIRTRCIPDSLSVFIDD